MYVPTSIGDFGPIVCILNMCLHVRQHVSFLLLVHSQKYLLAPDILALHILKHKILVCSIANICPHFTPEILAHHTDDSART